MPFPSEGLIGDFSGIIQHEVVKDMLGVTMLIYDYAKKFTMEGGMTIESFVSQRKGEEDNEIDLDVTDERKEMLDKLSQTSPNGKVVDFISDPDTDLQVGITVSEKNKRIVTVFRGSESKSDWWYDFMIYKSRLYTEEHDDCCVHTGFLKQLHTNDVYLKILKTVTEQLQEHPDYEVYVTGHSLGAALATLCGFEFAHNLGDSKITVVSFASPRVGNQKFKEVFDAKENLVHYRVTNNRDIITAAPMIFYKHVGTNIALSEKKCELYKKYEYGWFKYSLFNCFSVSDHNVDLYYNRLCKHAW